MKTNPLFRLPAVMACFLAVNASAQTAVPLWEAYNDHRAGAFTAANTTVWEMRVTGSGGPLRDFATGIDLPVLMAIEEEGAGTDDFGLCLMPNTGSPAYLFFEDKCTIGGDAGIGQADNPGIVGIRNSETEVVRLRFTALDPNKLYNFRGTVTRGGNYNDRWTYFKIIGAESWIPAHTDGSANRNLFTAVTFPASALAPDEVALNSGDNKAGSIVGWDNIRPGEDGTFGYSFAIEARQYVGAAPFGNPSAGPYGYGFNVFYLAEFAATGGITITANPENKLVPAGTTAGFTVAATSANPITYQWQSTTPGGNVFTDIPGATSATYTTPTLTAAQDNTKFRAVLTAGADTATSGEATLRVDGVIPTIASITPGINSNALYVRFNEPMDATSMAVQGNYSLDGGLTVQAVTVIDEQNVKLSTSGQDPGLPYALTVNSVTDLAGNAVATNTSAVFTSYDVVAGYAGMEIWQGIAGDFASFLADPRYPANPDLEFAITALDSRLVYPADTFNLYGGRIRAWITPQVDGYYYFFLMSDNVGELYLSTDESFTNLVSIAMDTDAATGFQEPGFSTATSANAIQLLAGQSYALQVLWEEDNGADFCAVAWRESEDVTPADQLQPISGPVLSFYGPPSTALGTITGVSSSGGQLTVTWTGAGTLQRSNNLAAWIDLPGATSPYVTPMTDQKLFVRLRE
jgi:hypothetical protein